MPATINTLTAVCTALKAGLATVTGLTTSTVTDDDWRVENNASSVFIMPSGNGAQELAAADNNAYVYQVRYDVQIELMEKNTGDMARLYNDAQTHTDAILAWFRTNDALGDTSGTFATCHAGALRFQAGDVRNEGGGILWRVVTFTVPCLLTGLTG
jgi:hypothetical protein